MRFMMIVKANADSEAGKMPRAAELEAMGKYNQQLIDAGILLAAEGLHSSARGTRLEFLKDKQNVVEGPFAETKELIAGFWIIQVKSREEALEWARRIPFEHGEVVELRQVSEAADFADIIPEAEIAKEQAWRDANQKPITN